MKKHAPINSCLYRGHVEHRRSLPHTHQFRYHLYMIYLDLAELDQVFADRLFWSHRFPTMNWFRRADHLGNKTIPLDQAVRQYINAETGTYPEGPIRLLTHLRQFGIQMNPVSFYYVFSRDGETLNFVIAEVNNTPWGESHCYLLKPEAWRATPGHHLPTKKELHVSPFMAMEQEYYWRLAKPRDHLSIQIDVQTPSGKILDVSLQMQRVPLRASTLTGLAIRFPLLTLFVFLRIYIQALWLWLKKTPFYHHPKKRPDPGETS